MIKPHIHAIHAYEPPLESRSRDYLLCDFNERIDPVGEHVKRALIDYIQHDSLQIYPSYAGFAEKLARYCEVDPDHILATNGSDKGIELIIRATCGPGDEIVIPVPSFAIYRHIAQIEDLKIVSPLFEKRLAFPTQAVLEAITPQTKLIVIGYPNNPTGTMVPTEEILSILNAAEHAAVLVDECYFEYTRRTMKDYVGQYANLFVTRTFSKTWGLASLRLGYIISSADNIGHLKKLPAPFDVNQLSIVAATAALEDPAFMWDYVDEVMQVSMPLLTAFLDSRSVRYCPPTANFVLIYPKNAPHTLDTLRQEGILVRPQRGPLIENSLRVSVGRKADTERLVEGLAQAL